MKETILSVGIDIGTSTTQIVFSNITIQNLASDFSVPRIEIIDRTIIYESEIYFTPLKSKVEINMEKVRDIVALEYVKAGIDKNSLKTGAVVITGETARKENANEVLLYLSEFAGDFVVATAGPDLESIIAARGAGVVKYSKDNLTTVANYDVGGGTSNFALFKNGELLETSCLDIGGRLIKIDKYNNKITYIAPKIKELIAFSNIDLQEGYNINLEKLKLVVNEMTKLIEMSLGVREKNEFYKTILTVNGHDISNKIVIKNICFSGGVADAIYSDNIFEDCFKFDDIGILLGIAIKNSERLKQLNFIKPLETIRATVVGAGSHITEISGSTIEYVESVLPIKNLPILKLTQQDEKDMETAIKSKIHWFKTDGSTDDSIDNVAISFKGVRNPSFIYITELAKNIVSAMSLLIKNKMPLVIIVENDMAKALGQSIQAIIGATYPLVCIDSIIVDNGDYVDIGKPVGESIVLPVIVKTLVFK